MRKLILPTIAAISLGLSAGGCLEKRLEQDLPITTEIIQQDIKEGQRVAQLMGQSSEGFSKYGVSAIALAEINVTEKYELPTIAYSETDHTNKLIVQRKRQEKNL